MLYEYSGAIHIHSTHSDGTCTIPQIAAIAERSGLDYVLVTDHMTLAGQEYEGWRNGVLVLVGYEINDPADRNHYLACGLRRVLPEHTSAVQYVRDVKARGGLGFIAHPDEERHAIPAYPAFPWLDWQAAGFTGIEIWNQMSAWAEQLTRVNKFFKIFFPRRSIGTPPVKTLARWDELSKTRKVVGVGGVDVHAFGFWLGLFTLQVFPYKVYFKTVRTHLLLTEPLDQADAVHAQAQVYACLRQGRLFFANFRRGNATGFRFWAQIRDRQVTMGDEIALNGGGVDLWAKTPKPGTFRLIHNGAVVLEHHGREMFFSTDVPGVYRVEVLRNGKGWIYSNHIRIAECGLRTAD
jgi:hypothetical protein